MNKKDKRIIGRIHETFSTQAITKADSRFEKTNVAKPNEDSVMESKDWVDSNQK